MMLYLASNTIPDVSFAVNQCARFTHNTKVSHGTAVKMMCWYLQGTKENGLVFNRYKKLVVDCYSDADFAGLWGHEDHQDSICASSRTGFVATFANCSLLWVSNYIHILLYIHYIMSMWNCLVLLEHYFL